MAAKKKTPAKKSAPKKKPAYKAKAPAKKTGAKKPTGKKVVKGKKSATGAKKTATRKVAGKKSGGRTQRVAKRPALKRKVAAPKKKVVKVASAPLAPAPEALALAKVIVGIANEKKAENVLVIDTRARSASVGYDYVVLATGDSDRQLAAIQEGVDALLKSQGKPVASVEASPDWVCANFDEGVVAHFLTPDRREQVDFEELWKDAPRVTV